jgi:hypothetical protein
VIVLVSDASVTVKERVEVVTVVPLFIVVVNG